MIPYDFLLIENVDHENSFTTDKTGSIFFSFKLRDSEYKSLM